MKFILFFLNDDQHSELMTIYTCVHLLLEVSDVDLDLVFADHSIQYVFFFTINIC